jgi:YVTN family beta-propeller protein
MEFRLLGRLEVRDDGQELALGGGKQRALLAVLLLHEREAVSTDGLIDALWGERPPASALNSVHVYVSQLRRVLGEGRLVTRGRGYALELRPGELDLERFEDLLARGRRLLAAGDVRAAAETLREALDLWRGAPLADFAYDPFAQTEIARLEELRLAALEERIEADLQLGRHNELVPELEALVRGHPLRERLRGQLMLALYRAGRQADALEAYQQARSTLVEELGLEPGPNLQELERAILRQDAELAPSEPGGAVRLARRRGGLSLALGGALLLTAALAAYFLLRGGESVVSVAPDSVALVDSSSNRVAAAIPIAARPTAIAIGNGGAWIANGDNSVSRIDPETKNVRQTIQVGGGPAGVAVMRDDVWVANGLDGTVSRIDPEANQVVQTIDVGNGPSGIAGGENAVWVTNSADGTVSRIDPDAGRVTKTWPTAIGAASVAVGFDRLWVVSPPSGSVAALDPRSGQVLRRIGVGDDPDSVAAGAGAVWVTNRADGTVSKIDPRTGAVTDTIQVGRAPTGIAAGADRVWVANSGEGTLSRIDPADDAVVDTVRLGNPPAGVALSRRAVYVIVRSTGREHRGGTVRAFSAFGPDSIDPALATDPSNWAALILTNDGLVGFRRVGGVQGTQLVPDLALSLPTSSDAGKTYTFELRPGIRYSDGRLVRPNDFRRAIERAEASAGGSGYYGGIVGANSCGKGKPCDLPRGIVTEAGARTITFHLTGPDADFLFKLALPFAFAVPPGTPKHDVGADPVPATGPYRIAEFDSKRASLRLVRNTVFHEWSADAQPAGYPDAISWSWQPGNASAGVRRVERGSGDVALTLAPQLSKGELDRLATRYPAQLHVSTQAHTAYFFLNTRLPPFDNPQARRAVNDAFDREAFARLVGRSVAPTCQILAPNMPAYQRTCPYLSGGFAGLDSARRLVRASGTLGARVTVWTGSPLAAQGRYMVSVLNSLGYRARLKVVSLTRDPFAYFGKIMDSRTRAQTGYFGWAAEFPSAVDMIRPVFSCAGFVPADPQKTLDPSQFCDPSIDAQMKRAASLQAQDPPAANVLWQRIEREILAEAPMVPTSNRRNVDFVSKRVGNYQYHPQWGVLLDQLWVK